MRRLLPTLTFLGSLVAAAAPAHAAEGAVEVNFIAAARYADAGRNPAEATRNEATLAQFLQRLGARHLSPGRVLRIDVLDLDLAGTVRPGSGRGEVRVDKGGADGPRIRLHYALLDGGKVVASGDESLTDLDHLRRSDYGLADPLRHEKRLLQRWFQDRFVDLKAPAG